MSDKDKYKNMIISWEKRQEIERNLKEFAKKQKNMPREQHELPDFLKPGHIETEEEIAAHKRAAELEALIKRYGEMFPDSPPKDWYNTLHYEYDFQDKMKACVEQGIPMEELYPDDYDYFFDYVNEYGYYGPTHP